MKRVNEDLMEVAGNGDKAVLKAILLLPQCDPMSKDGHGLTALMLSAINGQASCIELLLPVSDALARNNNGRTALMCAALNGNTSCAELLIPVSDALAKDKHGKTASELARNEGHTSLAAFIDAYGLARIEMSTLHALASPGAPSKKASLRV